MVSTRHGIAAEICREAWAQTVAPETLRQLRNEEDLRCQFVARTYYGFSRFRSGEWKINAEWPVPGGRIDLVFRDETDHIFAAIELKFDSSNGHSFMDIERDCEKLAGLAAAESAGTRRNHRVVLFFAAVGHVRRVMHAEAYVRNLGTCIELLAHKSYL